ncbi:conserved hypothetical protein [Segniliparus rotundus DSM 44985]|uniref:Uncharacterized protein n=1 Tax=Segniliparus rotundus (strain ATCC BAA-972 / CDC 1076 / CIP 108378 / DSM 44985 / JCM 13578) TaxID=640132 RepID=D6Z7H8_SEGRD|nr:conserved hypothetical protein [Segniliparus rotundus DSM 44985]
MGVLVADGLGDGVSSEVGGGGGGAGSGLSVFVTVVVSGGGGAVVCVCGGGSDVVGGSSEEVGSENAGGMSEVLERAAGGSCFDGHARYPMSPATAARAATVLTIRPFDGPFALGSAGPLGPGGFGASPRR